MLYTRENVQLQNPEILHTELYGAGWNKVVFSVEAGSCIVGSIDSGITSPTSGVLL
jgi:hypothetical protein